MPLQAQRFAGNQTLINCVDGVPPHRMLAGEPDHDAVRRLQHALADLGYEVPGGADGVFGGDTGTAVVAFKTDEQLVPTDPVAARGTIGRLDAYFAHELADPDSADPSTDGLVDLTNESMEVAVRWIISAIDALNQFVVGEEHPEDPVWVDYSSRLRRNFHVTTADAATDNAILPLFHQAKRALASPNPFFVITALDRRSWLERWPGEDYHVAAQGVGSELYITPPFRNALEPEERAATLIRYAVGIDSAISLFAVPGSARFANLRERAMLNRMAYAAFAFETVSGNDPPFHGNYRWSLS